MRRGVCVLQVIYVDHHLMAAAAGAANGLWLQPAVFSQEIRQQSCKWYDQKRLSCRNNVCQQAARVHGPRASLSLSLVEDGNNRARQVKSKKKRVCAGMYKNCYA